MLKNQGRNSPCANESPNPRLVRRHCGNRRAERCLAAASGRTHRHRLRDHRIHRRRQGRAGSGPGQRRRGPRRHSGERQLPNSVGGAGRRLVPTRGVAGARNGCCCRRRPQRAAVSAVRRLLIHLHGRDRGSGG